MSLTATSLTTELAALAVTGVTRKLGYFPMAITSGDLPTLWVGVPKIRASEDTMRGGLNVTVTCDVTIASKPLLKGEKGEGYSANVTIMDALQAALVDWQSDNEYLCTWNIVAGVVSIGESSPGVPIMYHSMTATVEATELQ